LIAGLGIVWPGNIEKDGETAFANHFRKSCVTCEKECATRVGSVRDSSNPKLSRASRNGLGARENTVLTTFGPERIREMEVALQAKPGNDRRDAGVADPARVRPAGAPTARRASELPSEKSF
jgi:hypothetical protein